MRFASLIYKFNCWQLINDNEKTTTLTDEFSNGVLAISHCVTFSFNTFKSNECTFCLIDFDNIAFPHPISATT